MMRRRSAGYRPYGGRKKPWKRALLALLLVCGAVFAALEVYIAANSRTEISGEPEVMVIFGCKVETWGPSILLRDRLDTALAYLNDHPDITVVVAGGKGDDEHQSEAQCMYEYLTAHGVDGDRITLEDRSRNTWQNICYTVELFRNGTVESTGKILAVSSGFHLARIRLLWNRAWEGTCTLSTLAAPVSHLPSAVQMFFREPLALVKSFAFDR